MRRAVRVCSVHTSAHTEACQAYRCVSHARHHVRRSCDVPAPLGAEADSPPPDNASAACMGVCMQRTETPVVCVLRTMTRPACAPENACGQGRHHDACALTRIPRHAGGRFTARHSCARPHAPAPLSHGPRAPHGVRDAVPGPRERRDKREAPRSALTEDPRQQHGRHAARPPPVACGPFCRARRDVGPGAAAPRQDSCDARLRARRRHGGRARGSRPVVCTRGGYAGVAGSAAGCGRGRTPYAAHRGTSQPPPWTSKSS